MSATPRILTAWIAVVAAGWLASPPFQPALVPRRNSVSSPASDSSLQQHLRTAAPVLAPELAGLAPSEQLAVIAAMAAAALDVAELARLLEMAKSLPQTIEMEARQLVALRWLDFDPVKACEVASSTDGVLERWAARDPLAVIEHAKQPDYAFRNEAWQAGMKHLVKKDPQAAWDLYSEAPEEPIRFLAVYALENK